MPKGKIDHKVVVFVTAAQKGKLIDEVAKQKKLALKDGQPGQHVNVSSVLRDLIDSNL